MPFFICGRCDREGKLLFPDMKPPCPECGQRWELVSEEEQQVFDLVEVGGPLFDVAGFVDPIIEAATRKEAQAVKHG